MKNFLTFSLFCYLTLSLQALKAQNDCSISTSEETLNGNAVTATLGHSGSFFWGVNDNPGYSTNNDFPGLEVHSILAGGLWIGGFDGSDIKLAASARGKSSGKTDCWPGPLDIWGTTDAETCAKWDRHWKVTREEINNFLNDFNDGTLSDNHESVIGWPGRQNPEFFDFFGFELPTDGQRLAPYFDWNANGIYEPMSGEYPDINGADQAVFWVFNDAGNEHTESGASQIRMEVHALAYAYSSFDKTINNSTFCDLTFVNRAISTIEDAYVGLWLEPGLGCPSDDYFGSIPEKDMVYIYNQDATDGDDGCLCSDGSNTFCEEIPVMGIRFLEGPWAGRIYNLDGELVEPLPGEEPETYIELGMTNFMYFNKSGTIPPPTPGTDEPTSPLEFHNILSGKWRDGTSLTPSGDGYNLSGIPVTHAFPGNPPDPTEWSMCSAGLNGNNHNILMSSGPFRLESGSVNNLSFAIFHVEDVLYPCPNMALLTEACDNIGHLFNGTSSVEPELESQTIIKVSPNPFSEETQISLEGNSVKIETVELYNLSGQLVKFYKNVNRNTIVIDRTGLNAGMYFYKVTTNKQDVFGGKLIVE